MCSDNCSENKLLEAYRDHWRKLALYLLRKNTDMEIERDKWKRLFIQSYESDATSNEAMWAYRNETGKA